MAKQAAPSPQKSSMAFWKEKAASSLSASGRLSMSSGRTAQRKYQGLSRNSSQYTLISSMRSSLMLSRNRLVVHSRRRARVFMRFTRSSSATRFCSAFSLSRMSVTAAKVFFKASSVKGLST